MKWALRKRICDRRCLRPCFEVGFTPFACSFACFITGRFDQIKMSVAYSGARVRLVGTHAGVGIGEDGYSQQGLEDIALIRFLPTMEVFQPADDIGN